MCSKFSSTYQVKLFNDRDVYKFNVFEHQRNPDTPQRTSVQLKEFTSLVDCWADEVDDELAGVGSATI